MEREKGMVDEEVVMETIKKMKESGLEDSIVISTLQDIGLSEGEAKGYLSRVGKAPLAKAKPAAKKPSAAPAAEPFEEAAAPARKAEWPAGALKPAIKPALGAGEDAGEPGDKFGDTFGAEEAEALHAVMEGEPIEVEEDFGEEGEAPRPAVAADEIAKRTAEHVKYDIAERADESAMRHAATQAVLTGQSRQLGEMQKVIKKIEKRTPLVMPAGTPPEIKVIANELEGLRKDVEDTRAIASATRELMQKILEVNRKILSRLP